MVVELRTVEVVRPDAGGAVEGFGERPGVAGRVVLLRHIVHRPRATAVPRAGPLRRRGHVDGPMAQVARPLGRHEHERAGAVGLEAAVEEAERLDDARRCGMVGEGHRAIVHHGGGVQIRVPPERHGHVAQLLGGRAVAIHVAADEEGHADRGVEEPERKREAERRVLRAHAHDIARQCAPEAAELPHRDRSVDDDAVGGAGGDRHGGVPDRRAGPSPADDPRHAGVAHHPDPEVGGDEAELVPVVGERREAVDVGDGEAGVVHRAEDRLEGELVLRAARELSPLRVLGLGDADDRSRVLHRRVTRSIPPRGARAARLGRCRPRRAPLPCVPRGVVDVARSATGRPAR